MHDAGGRLFVRDAKLFGLPSPLRGGVGRKDCPCGPLSPASRASFARLGPRKGGGRRESPLLGRHLLCPALRQAACAGSARRAVAAELVEPGIEIDTIAAEAALGQDGGDVGRLLAGPQPMRIHDHARQPRRQRQCAETQAFGGDAAVGIERAELVEQAVGFLQGRRRWRIEKRQRRRIAHAPLREIEHQRGEIG